ncbi:MAG: gamma-glutamyl-gamma-aminobutyrate hydrolase family protein [Lachnospiraceae bacterium]|nr:gamma-glutamyl-gamma-aminobutyrate hydrolase family protein [Lachnospiraceae bacterium]
MPSPLVAIVGRSKDTHNYENALQTLGVSFITTLDMQEAAQATHLLLPGGGDITPAFFGQQNHGSRNIDTELDILQIQTLSLFMEQKKPVLGICKGLQIINVHQGGTINQHIDTANTHEWKGHDQQHHVYHNGLNRQNFFFQLYGTSTLVNSAHHQAIDLLGRDLAVVCRAGDNIVEGIMHTTLPVIAVQWHPERIMDDGGERLIHYFTRSVSIW